MSGPESRLPRVDALESENRALHLRLASAQVDAEQLRALSEQVERRLQRALEDIADLRARVFTLQAVLGGKSPVPP